MKLANSIIGVTGATGFVGKALCRRLASEGATVLSLVRHPGGGALESRFDLADRVVDPAVFVSPLRAVVHCAWDVKTQDLELSRTVNVQGTQWLMDQCRGAGVEQFVFISSLAAHETADSVYGRTKYEVETLLASMTGGQLVSTTFAPGTIIGSGGVFSNARAMVKRLPIIPVFYSVGSRRLQTVYIDDLCDAVIASITAKIPGRFVIADESGVGLMDFYRGLASLENRSPLMIRFPGDLALLVISLLESMGFKPPVTSGNLRGIRKLRHVDVLQSIRLLGCRPMSTYWQSLIRLAAAEGRNDIAAKISANYHLHS